MGARRGVGAGRGEGVGARWCMGASARGEVRAHAATNPPLAEVDSVLLWKNGYTQALLPQSKHIYILHEIKKKEKTWVFCYRFFVTIFFYFLLIFPIPIKVNLVHFLVCILDFCDE